jgi:DNA-binding NarL/FixJ family response regulator
VAKPSAVHIPNGNSVWSAEYVDRLVSLFSTCSALRQDGQLLVDQLRGSIDQLRELRAQLRAQAGTSSSDASSPSRAGLEGRYGLTRRELEVAKLLARGMSNASIARELRISAHTARHHTQRVLSKLSVHSRAEAGAKLRQ